MISKLFAFLRPTQRQETLGIAGLVLLGLLLVWLTQRQENSLPRAQLPDEQGEPEAVIEHLSLRHFDASGRLEQEAQAQQATQYENQRLWMAQPQGISWMPSGRWAWRAETGEWQQEQLLLTEAVELTPLDASSPYQPSLLTERLWVDRTTQRAWTPDPVALISPAGHTLAVGLEADLETGHLQLLQAVEGEYLLLSPASEDPLP